MPAWRGDEGEEWLKEAGPSAALDPGPAGLSLMSTPCLSQVNCFYLPTSWNPGSIWLTLHHCRDPPLPPASSFSLDHLPPPPNPTGRPERGTDYLGGSHCPGGSVCLLSPPAPLLCPGLALADQGFSTPLGLRGPLGPRVGILHLQKEMTFIIFVFQIEKGTNACFIF